MDLPDRLTRLRKDIETVVDDLEQLRSGLAGAGWALDESLRTRGPGPDDRPQQTQVAQVWRARWQEIEELATSLVRAADGLLADMDLVGSGNVDGITGASDDRAIVGDSSEATPLEAAAPDTARARYNDDRERRYDTLYRRLEEVEATLEKLADLQDGVELQLALLSREAEQDHRPAAVPASASAPGVAQLRRQLHAELAALKRAGATLHARLIQMESRGDRLQEGLDDLGLQQARQDTAARALNKRLRNRSVLGMTAFGLAAAVLLFVSLRLPTSVGSDGLAAPATGGTQQSEGPTAARFSEEIARLREDMADMGEALADTHRQLRGARAEVESGQARLRDDLDRVTAEVEALAADVQGLMKKAVDAPVASPATDPTTESSPTPVAPGSAAVTDPSPSLAPTDPGGGFSESAGKWARARARGHYTLQLMGVHERRHLNGFLERHRIHGDRAVYHRERGGRPWLELFHGIYRTSAQALAAARDLPADLAAQRPWVRKIPPTGRLEPL